MTHEPTDPSRPAVVLVGGAGAIALGVDVGSHALVQARERGLATHQINQADTLAATPEVAALADRSWPVDFMRPGDSAAWARESVARGQRIDVVIGVREFAQEATAEVAAAAGAPGNPPDAVRTVRNKDLCRAALAAKGFRQPAFRLCAGLVEAEDFVATTTGPWVVKPRDQMGSKGVSKVEDLASLAAAVAALGGDEPFLVEEFVSGKEYSVEGVFLGGRPHVLAVTEKQLMEPLFVEVGHVLPAPLPESVSEEFATTTAAALEALGLRYGVFHVELWHTAQGVVLGEVHVRNGGDWIHLLLQYAIPGLELFGVVYDDALGKPVDVAALTPARGAAVRFLTPPAGVLERIDGWEQVTSHPAVLRAWLGVEPGAVIPPVTESYDRVGEIVVGAETPEKAAELVRELADSVTFVVSPAHAGSTR